jgi:hypothetical protein
MDKNNIIKFPDFKGFPKAKIHFSRTEDSLYFCYQFTTNNDSKYRWLVEFTLDQLEALLSNGIHTVAVKLRDKILRAGHNAL